MIKAQYSRLCFKDMSVLKESVCKKHTSVSYFPFFFFLLCKFQY